MTRIVVDPAELNRIADHAVEAADAYAAAAESLTSRPLPAMPPALASAIEAGIARIAERLEELSSRLNGRAYLLRSRAAVVDGGTASRLLLSGSGDTDE